MIKYRQLYQIIKMQLLTQNSIVWGLGGLLFVK